MSYDGSVEVNEVALPGVGLRHDFVTEKGRRLGVISHRGGKRELVIYGRDDPDACTSLNLSSDEADTLAEFLGTHRVIERLSALSDQVAGLQTRKVPVTPGSRYDGRKMGDTQVRTRTGASIVAVLRDGEAIASPTPDFLLRGDDLLIVVGTEEALSTVGDILAE